MMTGEPVNVSGRSHGVVCGWRVRLGAWRTSFGRSHELYVMEELDPMCEGGDC